MTPRNTPMGTPPSRRTSVVIVGGGMGGIQAAKTLATVAVDITLVNSHNYYLFQYYLFQPLIYEVANALLQAEEVAHSIRGMLRYLPNWRFQVAAASSVDWQRRELHLGDGDRIGFDYLILATGLETDFRGIPGAAEHALPLITRTSGRFLRGRCSDGFRASGDLGGTTTYPDACGAVA
jgi:NADH dehydrogenase